MRKFLVFVIFVLIAVAIADRGLHYAAESEIASRVEQQYEMSSEPEVTIGGFPFLTQAISGEYDRIRIVTGAIVVGDVQLERVDVTARDVRAPLADLMTEPSVVAGTARAKVMLPYSELQKRLPEGIVIENENGSPRMSGDLALGQYSTPVSADLEVAVEGDTILVTPSNIEIGQSQLGGMGLVEDMLAMQVPVPEMPFGLEVTGIEALPNGVEVSAEASDVELVGSPTTQG
ncbi:LmeA family phospholipid-binding protein [Streptomonospora litoralis]|uniref:DUF2993 domain-containing protein n=1 Tax=Streptomonospora litoralis TaxID=2498135 RepID=A0A4P6PVJ3_9ACTN|nr:DUF2993 domain-containing protein [Streptomonospora litoralis]QBI52168.1 hypothetical protein EKD16_01755 [Streptomonospora litoralis]